VNIYEWGAVQAFRRGDRKPLLKLLRKRNPKQPLSNDLLKIFIDLVDGKTGRPRGRPKADIEDQMLTAYRVAVQIRQGLRVKEALDRVSIERKQTFSYVERAHQKYSQHAALFLEP